MSGPVPGTLSVGVRPIAVGPPQLDTYPVALPTLPVPWVPFTEDNFLDRIKTLLPPEYWEPMEVNELGWELFQQSGAQWERISQAITQTWNGLYVLSAGDAAYSIGAVAFQRPTAQAGTVVLKAGTIVGTPGGRRFKTLLDVTLPAAGGFSLGPVAVTVQALFPSPQWNVLGPQVTKAGELIPGEINQIVTPLAQDGEGAPAFDPSITVVQVSDCVGGQTADLDALGQDRGMPRNPGEDDDAYRLRIRVVQDQITPAEVLAAVNRYLRPFQATAQFLEPWAPGVGFTWYWNAAIDAWAAGESYADWPGILNGFWNTPYEPFKNRWLSPNTAALWFAIVIPNLPAISEQAGYWNDPAFQADSTASDWETPIGQRALFCWNAPPPSGTPTPPPLRIGFFDAPDQGRNAAISGLFALLAQIAAAGVGFSVEIQDIT